MTISRNLKDYGQFGLFILILAIFLTNNVAFAKKHGWELVKNSQTIKIYKKHNNTTKLNQIKAELVVQSSLSGFILFIQDTANISNWLANATHSQILEQITPTKNVFITYFNGVWPIKARDMVIESEFIQHKDMTIDIIAKDASDKVPASPNTIRVTVEHAKWHIAKIQNTDNIKVRYEFSVNPNGTIPSWLANKMTLSSVLNTLKAIEQQLPTSNWQQYQIKEIIEP